MKRFCVALCGLWVALTLASCYGGPLPGGETSSVNVLHEEPWAFELVGPGPIPIHTGRPYEIRRYLPHFGLQKGSISVYVGKGFAMDTRDLFETFQKDSFAKIDTYYVKALESIATRVGLKGFKRVEDPDQANLILDSFTASHDPYAHGVIAVTMLVSNEQVLCSQKERTFWTRITQTRYPNFDNDKTGMILFNFDRTKEGGRYTQGLAAMHQVFSEDVTGYTKSRSMQEITIERLLAHEFGHYLGLTHPSSPYSLSMAQLGLHPKPVTAPTLMDTEQNTLDYQVDTLNSRLSLTEKRERLARYNANDKVTLKYLFR